jgi:glycogen operon protein
LVRFRLDNPTLRRRSFLEGGASEAGGLPDVEWFSPDGSHVDWYAADASLVCFFGAPSLETLLEEDDVAAGGVEGRPRHVLIFAHSGSLPRRFHFPRPEAVASLPWRLFVDTRRSAPDDIFPSGEGPLADCSQPLELSERSLVCFVAEAEPGQCRKRIASEEASAV